MSRGRSRSMFGVLVLLAASLFSSPAKAEADQEVPNILWLTIEDTSYYEFGCYGNTQVKTPHIDALAEKGVRFTNASSVAPQCSPARSTLISGVFATTYGTGLHRATYRSPKDRPFLPQLMKRAGYYCINVTKRDYNTPTPKNLWDQGNRYTNSKKPFFAVYNNGDCHMTSVRKEALPPSDIDISHLPYLPNLPEIRANYAAHLREIEAIDRWVGSKLAELEASGRQEDTVIFFYSDHGGCQPRGKAFAYETGLRVPFIVYVPEKWQHLAGDLKMGTVSDRLIGFEDLAPTALSLVGREAPPQMQGKAFMGEHTQEPKAYQFGFRSNQGFHFDPVRTVSDGRYKYIRNYAPHKPLGMRQDYQWGMGANMIYDLANLKGELAPEHAAFFQAKPSEMLFDLTQDPWEMNNLAGSPEHQEALENMRAQLGLHLRRTKDLGFFLQGVRKNKDRQKAIKSFYDWVREVDYPLEDLYQIAEVASAGNADNVPVLIDHLTSKYPSIRFWAASGFITLGSMGHRVDMPEQLVVLLEDDNEDVAAAAAEALCYHGQVEQGLRVLMALIQKGNKLACSSLEGFLKHAGPVEQIESYLPTLKAIAAQHHKSRESLPFYARSILLECGVSQTPFDLYKDKLWNEGR